MSGLTVCFTAKEIFRQIYLELIKLNVNIDTIPLDTWKKYIMARVIEDMLMVDLTPSFDARMQDISTIVRSNYRRSDGYETFNIYQDVGTNKIFPHIGSGDLSFESNVELHRHCVLISPRGIHQ